MGTITYDSFLRDVIPYCNGAPEMVAIHAIRNACIEFCEQTDWIQYTLTPMTGVANTWSYELDTPMDTRLGRVINLYYDTWKLTPCSEEELAALWGIDWRTITGQPRQFTRTDDTSEVTFCPYPVITEAAAITGLVSVVPLRHSQTCDGVLHQRFSEVIAAGALARLMETPAQSYTNMAMAQAKWKIFKSGIAEARIQRMRGVDRAVLNFRPPRFI